MPWTYPAYEGLRGTGEDGRWTIAMFELIRAIDQRNTALGDVYDATFYKDDGTTANVLTLEECKGLRMSGFTARFSENMQTIHAAIKVLASNFTVSSGRSASYTGTSLMAAVGLSLAGPETGGTPDKWQDYRWWQGWQDALDLLIYGYQSNPGAVATHLLKTGDSAVGLDEAWNEAYNKVVYSSASAQMFDLNIGAGGFHVKWIVDLPPASDYFATIAQTLEGTVTPTITGSLAEVWLDAGPDDSAFWTYHGYGDTPHEFEFNSATDVFTATSTTNGGTGGVPVTENYTRQLVNGDFPLGAAADFTIEIQNTPPAVNPITETTPSTAAGWAAFFGNITYYSNLAGELDDQ